MRAYIWLFLHPTSLNFRKALKKKVRELLQLTMYNYAELKLTVIADLVSFSKKRVRVVPVLVPPDTLKLIDIMINDENLKNKTYFF